MQVRPRLEEVDIQKGLLMILVVLGHSSFSHKNYIYWFHMPVFFFISGFFFKTYNKQLPFIIFLEEACM